MSSAERGRVVEAVSDHQHLPPLGAEHFEPRDLVARKHPKDGGFHADQVRGLPYFRFRIAREDLDTQTESVETLCRGGGSGA